MPRKRASGRSGASNWDRGDKAARERTKAERKSRVAERAAAKDAAFREVIDEMDDNGRGPFAVRSPAESLAIAGLRQTLAAEMGVSPNRLSPSAAIAATLVPGSIDAYTDGYVVIMPEGRSSRGPHEGLRVRKGAVMCEFVSPGVQRAIVFHTRS